MTRSEKGRAQRTDEQFNHFIRSTAAFALQSLEDAKDALLAEGGEIPDPRVLEVVHFPKLPKVPEPCFPDEPAPGSDLPSELL